MKEPELRGRRTAAAVPVYLILLMSLQVFLVTVVVEAFLIGDASLAWSTAVISVVLAAAGTAFLRYLHR